MNVKMSEVIAVSANEGEKYLITHGISTCIAIMLYGIYNDTPFILMDHWDGELEEDNEHFLQYKIINYITKIENATIKDFDPDIHDHIPVYIEKLIIVGGERKQFDKDGDLLVTGTESSVTFLEENLESEIGKHCIFTKTAAPYWKNYITSNDQSLTVKIDCNGFFEFYFETIENTSGLQKLTDLQKDENYSNYLLTM